MSSWEIITGCYIGGIILVMFELILPGGVLGAVGGILIIIGTYYAGKDLGIAAAAGLFLASTAIVGIAFYILYRSPFGQILILSDQLPKPEQFNEIKTGDSGLTTTDLRPSGKATFILNGRERHVDVVTSGDFLAKHEEILVSSVEGQKIIVSRKGDSRGV